MNNKFVGIGLIFLALILYKLQAKINPIWIIGMFGVFIFFNNNSFEQFETDISAIKHYNEFVAKLSQGGITVPGNLTIAGDIKIQGKSEMYNDLTMYPAGSEVGSKIKMYGNYVGKRMDKPAVLMSRYGQTPDNRSKPCFVVDGDLAGPDDPANEFKIYANHLNIDGYTMITGKNTGDRKMLSIGDWRIIQDSPNGPLDFVASNGGSWSSDYVRMMKIKYNIHEGI